MRLLWTIVLSVALSVCGCGDFFAEKPAEMQTETILRELRQVKENPNVNNPLPELYRRPAERVRFKDGVKVFYFTRHNTPDRMAGLIRSQLAHEVSLSEATNQVIVHCSNDAEADKVLEFLDKVDVPPIQVNVDCLILERFADVTMDWETTIKIENFLGESITLGGKTDSVTGDLLPNFPGASLRESRRADFGLDVGFWKNKGVLGHEFSAMVDLLISRGYLKVLMNPKLETVNGRKAVILSRDYAPLEKIVTAQGVDPYSLTEYQWVEDTLEVTPYVYSDGSVGLATTIKLGSRSKPEGVVQTSIITERSIQLEENRIRPGQSLIVGGIRKTEERAVVRGIPFFKDLPVLGILFSSKDYEERATEVIFILTPSISSGGVMHADMIEKVRDKFRRPKYEYGLGDVLTDPLGTGMYSKQAEQRAADAELRRIRAEIEKADALQEVGDAKARLLKVADEVIAQKAEAVTARREAETARVQVGRLKEELEKLKSVSEQQAVGSQRSEASDQ